MKPVYPPFNFVEAGGITIRSPDPKMYTCNHAVTRGQFWNDFEHLNWQHLFIHHQFSFIMIDFGHHCLIKVIVVLLMAWEAYHRPQASPLAMWWASQVVNETTLTSILVSIPITIHIGSLSFHIKAMLCGGCDYKSMNLTKPGYYVLGYTLYYMCIKFKSSSINNSLRNSKKVQILN